MTTRPTDPKGAPSERAQLQGFADLIRDTRDRLRAAVTPAQLAAAVDAVLGDWSRTDRDFAGVLSDIKGQSWSMQGDQLRAIRDRIVSHLEVNLAEVQKRLR